LRIKLFGSKTRQINDPPKPIAAASEVMTRRCSTNAGVDAAEDHRQVRFENIGK
jgi:hypothetical protein